MVYTNNLQKLLNIKQRYQKMREMRKVCLESKKRKFGNG